MSEKIIRAVIDTQVFLRAAINRQSLPAKVLFDLRAKFQLLASSETTAEVRHVLNRPELRAKFKLLNDEVVITILQLLETTEQVQITQIEAISRDPKDDMFLACAKAGNADYIISEDKDLLVLNPWEGIQIINVLDFFHILQASNGNAE